MAKKVAAKTSIRQITITDHVIKDFFTSKYMDYCMYTIGHRALPSIIDGLKPGARKVMHSALKILRTDKETNFIDLVGTTMSYSKYHHGDASLVGTILTLSTKHNDSLAPLQAIGADGDLRSPEFAAGRYLGIQLSKWSKLLQKDQHILEYNYDGDIQVEPTHYLPLIPLVLAARSTGMAVAYKYDAQVSYNPADIVEQCINVIETGKLKSKLHPHIEQYGGNFVQYDDRTWAEGNWSIHNDHIIVTEFSPLETSVSFESNLKKLLATGKILNWDDLKDDDNPIKYKITINPETLKRQIDKKLLKKTYLLGAFLKRPTYTLLNEYGKIAIFQSAEDVLKYFTEFRLGLYDKLKSVNIANLNKQIQTLSDLRRFIDLFLSDNIVINKDTKIEENYKVLDKEKLPRNLMDTAIKKLTKDEYDKLTSDIEKLRTELEVITMTPTKVLYLRELNVLLKEMKQEFPLQPFTIGGTL